MTSSADGVAKERVDTRARAVCAQVAANPVAQDARFAHVQRVAAGPEKHVHTGLLGQPADLALEIMNGHGLRCARLSQHSAGSADSIGDEESWVASQVGFNFCDFHRRHRRDVQLSAPAHHRRVRPSSNSSQYSHVHGRRHQHRRRLGARHRTLRVRRPHHGRRERLRLHRRQSRHRNGRREQVRRLLGLGHRPLLGPGAVHRAHLPLFVARAHGLRAHHLDRDGVRDHDELHARARRVARAADARSGSWNGPSASCSS